MFLPPVSRWHNSGLILPKTGVLCHIGVQSARR